MRVSYGTIIFVLLCLSGNGCATYGDLEKDYGKSYAAAVSGQILNPEASRNLNPVTGLPGDVASTTYDKYIKSFNKDANKPGKKDIVLPVIPKDLSGGRDGYEK